MSCVTLGSVVLYAYMGREDDAIREGKRATELKTVADDADAGAEQLCNLALIYTRVGETDQAISLIDKLLRMPGGVFFSESSMSLWELRLGWQWDPLPKRSTLHEDSLRARAADDF